VRDQLRVPAAPDLAAAGPLAVATVIARLEGGAGVLALRGALAMDPQTCRVTIITGQGDQLIAAEAQGFSGFPGDKFPGLFAVYAVPLPGHTPDQMREAIHKELDRLKNEDVSDAELERFKTRARADLLRGLGDNEGLAHELAEYQTRFGDWRQLFRELDKINAVNKADIRRVANKIFVESNRTSARIEFVPPPKPSDAPVQSRLTPPASAQTEPGAGGAK